MSQCFRRPGNDDVQYLRLLLSAVALPSTTPLKKVGGKALMKRGLALLVLPTLMPMVCRNQLT